jgi:adenosylhomocysteine nucleosidase
MLVLTPQLVELESLLDGFYQIGCELSQQSIDRVRAWTIPALSIRLAAAGHGKAQFAVQTQYLLDRLPDTKGVVCTGGAGGLDPRLRVGDIVIGTSTVEHDYLIRFFKVPLTEHPGHRPFLSALQRLSNVSQDGCRFWFDRIASGDEDIVDTARATRLRDATGAVCVAWEGSGGARAAAFNDIPFIEIRGITDAANESAHGDYHSNLKIVMPRIARLLADWRQYGPL